MDDHADGWVFRAHNFCNIRLLNFPVVSSSPLLLGCPVGFKLVSADKISVKFPFIGQIMHSSGCWPNEGTSNVVFRFPSSEFIWLFQIYILRCQTQWLFIAAWTIK